MASRSTTPLPPAPLAYPEPSGPRSVAVIGGGISGLASAFRIAGLGHRVTLIEGEGYLGGLGTTFPYRGGRLERFYHCILPDDDALVRLIREVGMADDLLWKNTGMGFMHRGRVYPLNGPLDLLRFRPLRFIDRIRLGLLAIRARIGGLNPRLDQVGVADWMTKMVGKRAFRTLWKPLLEAKIGDAYHGIPALWLSSRMAREKNTKAEVKGCLRHGYGSLIDAIEASLIARGVEIRLNTRVASIDEDGDRMVVAFEDGVRQSYDTVVATSPIIQFQRMTASLDIPPALRDLQLDYQGVVSGVFLLRRPLSPYYWMPIVESGATAQGVIEMSNLVPLERSDGMYVTYLVNYTHRTSPLFARSDEDLLGGYRSDLARLFGIRDDEIADAYVFRAPFVEPLWSLGYSEKRPRPDVIPGKLYLAGTSQVYPRVNSWNSCCDVVEEMVSRFAEDTSAARETALRSGDTSSTGETGSEAA